MLPLVNITIPTYNRAFCLAKAIEGALDQSYHHLGVTVIDDGSTDETAEVLRDFEGEDGFCAVRLGRNVGTANAKNVSILLSQYDAITFHDSDDLPNPNKLLFQARALAAPHHAAPILDWQSVGQTPDAPLGVDVVVGAHDLVKVDGSVTRIDKRLSLVDDFFPNLQFPSKTEGDWILINSGLFRKRVFEEVGGYDDSVEEDRELRNRTIAAGYVYYFVDQPLLTKIEMPQSLTTDEETGYAGAQREADRRRVWERKRAYLASGFGEAVRRDPVQIDLAGLPIEEVINPQELGFNKTIPMTEGTRETFEALFAQPA